MVTVHGKCFVQDNLDQLNAWRQVQHDSCRYLQATAALIQQSGSSMQPKLLHLIAWLPAHRFGTFSMSLAVFAWHWIFAESPDLQVGSSVSVMRIVIKFCLASRHQVHALQVSSLQTGLFRASWVKNSSPTCECQKTQHHSKKPYVNNVCSSMFTVCCQASCRHHQTT